MIKKKLLELGSATLLFMYYHYQSCWALIHHCRHLFLKDMDLKTTTSAECFLIEVNWYVCLPYSQLFYIIQRIFYYILTKIQRYLLMLEITLSLLYLGCSFSVFTMQQWLTLFVWIDLWFQWLFKYVVPYCMSHCA